MVVPFQADFTAIYKCVPKESSEGSPKEIQKIVVFLFINVVRQEKKKDPSGSILVCFSVVLRTWERWFRDGLIHCHFSQEIIKVEKEILFIFHILKEVRPFGWSLSWFFHGHVGLLLRRRDSSWALSFILWIINVKLHQFLDLVCVFPIPPDLSGWPSPRQKEETQVFVDVSIDRKEAEEKAPTFPTKKTHTPDEFFCLFVGTSAFLYILLLSSRTSGSPDQSANLLHPSTGCALLNYDCNLLQFSLHPMCMGATWATAEVELYKALIWCLLSNLCSPLNGGSL